MNLVCQYRQQNDVVGLLSMLKLTIHVELKRFFHQMVKLTIHIELEKFLYWMLKLTNQSKFV